MPVVPMLKIIKLKNALVPRRSDAPGTFFVVLYLIPSVYLCRKKVNGQLKKYFCKCLLLGAAA